MSEGAVILVDDEPYVLAAAQQTLELADFDVVPCTCGAQALTHLARDLFAVLVTDVKMPGMDGFDLMQRVQAFDPELPIVMITGHGDISMAVQSIRSGAYDFIEKPYQPDFLVDVVRRALEKRRLLLENRALRHELNEQSADEPAIIGRSDAAQRLRETISKIAAADADVLIVGETGSGKELAARSLHGRSSRRNKRFVALNCGAIPESLIESELFGHEPGAFTHAVKRRIGRFEYAGGGTVFLDEIESMPLSLQVKLLRVLQERVVERLGSNQSVPVDVRVVAATKLDLRALIAKGAFREDLYYRLNVLQLRIPALRERLEDAPPLFEHFALRACARFGREPVPLSPETVREIMSQSWPGNIRELQNAAERYALGCYESLPIDGDCGVRRPGLAEQVGIFEKSLILQELAHQKGNVKATYEALGLPRKTLYDKMRKYGITRLDVT